MSHVRLAVRDIPDEQLSIRPGGLYWVTVDRTGDAEILAVQALMALPAQHRATLVWSACADSAISPPWWMVLSIRFRSLAAAMAWSSP